MPKKSAAARGGAQRNRPKVQKSIELVRQTIVEKEAPIEEKNAFEEQEGEVDAASTDESTSTSTSTVVTLEAPSKKAKSDTAKKNVVAPRPASSVQKGTSAQQEDIGREPEKPVTSRSATRRQTGQKTQRVAVSLISAEHYGYVRNELVIIAILAFIFFAVII